MSKNGKAPKLASDILHEVASESGADKITLFEIKAALHERGFGILIILFCIPVSLPVPVPPGYTTIFSMPLILFSLQLLLGYGSPWIPQWIERKSFKRSALALMVEKASPILKRIEKFIKPRAYFVFYGPGEKVLAFIMLLCAISIALPLPLTNFIPAIGTVLISLGIMSKDGLLSILGVLVSLCGLTLTLIIIIGGPKLIFGAFSLLKRFLLSKGSV